MTTYLATYFKQTFCYFQHKTKGVYTLFIEADKLRVTASHRLRLFEHVMRTEENEAVKAVMNITVKGKKVEEDD